jgi:hypothetical protein
MKQFCLVCQECGARRFVHCITHPSNLDYDVSTPFALKVHKSRDMTEQLGVKNG